MKFIIPLVALISSAFAQDCETQGNYRCADEGNAPEFFICGIGNIEVPMVCGPGTICRQLGLGVYCDYPSRSLNVTLPEISSAEPSSLEESSTEASLTGPETITEVSTSIVTTTEKTTEVTTVTEAPSSSEESSVASSSENNELSEILSLISSELATADLGDKQCSAEDDGKYFCPGASGEGSIILWCLGERLIPIDCAEGQVCTIGDNNSTFCGSTERVTVSSFVSTTTTNIVTTTVTSSSLVVVSSSI